MGATYTLPHLLSASLTGPRTRASQQVVESSDEKVSLTLLIKGTRHAITLLFEVLAAESTAQPPPAPLARQNDHWIPPRNAANLPKDRGSPLGQKVADPGVSPRPGRSDTQDGCHTSHYRFVSVQPTGVFPSPPSEVDGHTRRDCEVWHLCTSAGLEEALSRVLDCVELRLPDLPRPPYRLSAAFDDASAPRRSRDETQRTTRAACLDKLVQRT